MTTIDIFNGRVVCGETVLPAVRMTIEDGRIAALGAP